MSAFDESLYVMGLGNAEFFARQLFFESFAQGFPVPSDNCGLPIPTPPSAWHQYVALYRWPDGKLETVGFCNWIRFGDVYLEGGMCVSRTFYRRLPREQWRACRDRGGIAQILMESAAKELDDCVAWFGYCGDKKAYLVDSRVGYVPTGRPYLIVKWFKDVPEAKRRSLEDAVAAIGPF